MIDDAELLRHYASEGSERAFAELVERYVNFVYACALRRVGGDAHLAKDVTQQTFTALARGAKALSGRPVLTGWLFTTARNVAAQTVRTERRRQHREQEAYIMDENMEAVPTAAEWQRLRPVIDSALDELRENDREAVLLRFFEGKSFAEVGAKLRLTENTARMRVERALEKMNAGLNQRGIKSTAAALGLVLTGQAAVVAPAGWSVTVAGAAMAGGAASGGVAAGSGAVVFMGMTKNMIVGWSIALGVGLSVTVVGAGQVHEARAELSAALKARDAEAAKLSGLEARLKEEARRGQAAEVRNGQLLAEARAAQTDEAANDTVTADILTSRLKRLDDLLKSGDPAEALKEFVWCYDVGTVRAANGRQKRGSMPLLLWSMIKTYPPAREVLRERRDLALKALQAGDSAVETSGEFGMLNQVLGDDQSSIAFFDQLPEGDRRRRTLAGSVHEALIERQRYADAILGQPYPSIVSLFELMQNRPMPPEETNPEESRRKLREYLIKITTMNVEALAGTGDLVHARTLATKLLNYDTTEATKAMLQQRLLRAGQPELLSIPVNKP